MKELVEDERLDVNFLLSQSLITVSTLPFHLVNDLWRWRAFRGEFDLPDWNAEYWKLKEEIVGVRRPVESTPEDLDPPAIFHIAQDFDMMRWTFFKFFMLNTKLNDLNFSDTSPAPSCSSNLLRLCAGSPATRVPCTGATSLPRRRPARPWRTCSSSAPASLGPTSWRPSRDRGTLMLKKNLLMKHYKSLLIFPLSQGHVCRPHHGVLPAPARLARQGEQEEGRRPRMGRFGLVAAMLAYKRLLNVHESIAINPRSIRPDVDVLPASLFDRCPIVLRE